MRCPNCGGLLDPWIKHLNREEAVYVGVMCSSCEEYWSSEQFSQDAYKIETKSYSSKAKDNHLNSLFEMMQEMTFPMDATKVGIQDDA